MAVQMEDESTIQKNIADKLISALKTGGFVLYAQKILALGASREERPFQEVLVRFKEEEEKLLPPGTFFPMLQEYRLLPYVDRWVVSRLATLIQDFRAQRPGLPQPAYGINLAEDTLRESKFTEFVARHIQNSKIPEGTLTFEVGWDTALVHSDDIKLIVSQLRPIGCRFTFAGFDGSDGSFNFLKVLKPDFVKLTYGIVKDIGRALAASERAESINQRLHDMGIRTIAEFVESNEVLENLKLVEVDFAQGLVIGGPQKLA
jgi:EAL domain-containing protein (putative c-di-GMP-specific phosphodiesterase class I)